MEGALVAAGFFVARANDSGSGGGESTPIGSASLQETNDNYSPLYATTVREPWIWRRTWMLGNPSELGFAQAFINNNTGVGQTLLGTSSFPPTTAHYGSVSDGAHIDAKTARRVTQDERLWFAVSAVRFPIGTVTVENPNLRGYLDVRLLAGLRKAHNRGVF